MTEGSRIRSFAASSDLSRGVICKWDSTVVVKDLQSGEVVSVLQKWGMRDSSTGHTSGARRAAARQRPRRRSARPLAFPLLPCCCTGAIPLPARLCLLSAQR